MKFLESMTITSNGFRKIRQKFSHEVPFVEVERLAGTDVPLSLTETDKSASEKGPNYTPLLSASVSPPRQSLAAGPRRWIRRRAVYDHGCQSSSSRPVLHAVRYLSTRHDVVQYR